MNSPLLSIVVPYYNAEPYFDECVASLYEECRNDPRIEVILVDDGSTDGSPATAQSYAARLPEQIRTVTQANGGQGAATNTGMEMARGAYVGFTDSDDWIDRGMYGSMLDTALETEADMVVCDFKKVLPDGTTRVIRYLQTGAEGIDPHIRPDVIFSVGFSPWNKVLRREFIHRHALFFPTDILFQDLLIFVLATSKAHKIVNTGTAGYNYRIREGSQIHSWHAKAYDIFEALDRLIRGVGPEFRDAVGFLVVQELLFHHLPRYVFRAHKHFDDYFDRSLDFVNTRFPDIRANPYLRSASLWERTYVFLCLKRRQWQIRTLARMKQWLKR